MRIKCHIGIEIWATSSATRPATCCAGRPRAPKPQKTVLTCTQPISTCTGRRSIELGSLRWRDRNTLLEERGDFPHCDSHLMYCLFCAILQMAPRSVDMFPNLNQPRVRRGIFRAGRGQLRLILALHC